MTPGAPAAPELAAGREVDVVLRDGTTARLRPLRPDDESALRVLLEGLSPASRRMRYFTSGVDLAAAAAAECRVEDGDRYGLVAFVGGELVGHAGWVGEGRDRAEVAFAVADRCQGKGLGTLLLAHLVDAAEGAGIATLTGVLLPENHRMIEVFRESGLTVRTWSTPGAIRLAMPASLSPEAGRRFAEREREAVAASVAHVLRPASVAVVGASEREGSLGGAVVRNLRAAGYTGRLVVVHPRAETVLGVEAHPTLRAAGGAELAVVAVPAARVLDVARDAAASGVCALVVISAGFAETGAEGAARQDELVAICREAGMRVVGPNCLGVFNTAPDVRLDATFAPTLPPPGRIAFLSQSGALGIAAIDVAQRRALGLSSFVSAGNKADLSGNDFLEHWEGDDATSVVMLYLESFGNPRRFARIARRVSRTKPIVAVKAGRSIAGGHAAASHTGALLAASDRDIDALCRHAGVIRTDTLSELFDVGVLLADQPAPRGSRVGIITNGGGLGILCADACEAAGLEPVELSEPTRAPLRELVAPEASLRNPLDLLATAGPDAFAAAVRQVGRSGEVDALIVLFVQAAAATGEEVARAVSAAAAGLPDLPVATVFMLPGETPRALSDGPRPLPAFEFPEQAAMVMARAATYGTWRARPVEAPPAFPDARTDEAAALIAAELGRGAGWMEPAAVGALLDAHRIPTPAARVTDDPAGAERAARELGGPVALKAIVPGLLHKSDAGGVRIGLADPAEVAVAARDMTERLGDETRFLVQAMAPRGVELLVGVVHDPSFGPVVALAAGGTEVELLKDTAIRLAPLTPTDAREMIHELKTFPLLDGFRGRPKLPVGALEELLLRVSALVEEHEEVAELELNPVVLAAAGALAVDARVRLAAAPPRAPWPSLQA